MRPARRSISGPCTVRCGNVGLISSRGSPGEHAQPLGHAPRKSGQSSEMSTFSALGLSPAASSQTHKDDFLKTATLRNLTGSTRRLSAVYEGRRYTPSATASTYASQQFRGPCINVVVVSPKHNLRGAGHTQTGREGTTPKQSQSRLNRGAERTPTHTTHSTIPSY